MARKQTTADSEISTAPHIDAQSEIAELKAEIARLRRELAAQPVANEPGNWPEEIDYHQQPMSGARLTGISSNREAIRPSSEFPELPVATSDQAQLERDFMRWGYCIVKDAMTKQQVQQQITRLLDQASAERAAKVAHMSHHGAAQTVFNMLAKGRVFRDLAALEPMAASGAPVVEALLEKILGSGFYLATAHGSIVNQGGGRQELHQDQGFVPLPHPPYPLYCLIIWTYSDFDLQSGGTYVVPGSHRNAAGENLVRPEVAFEALAQERIIALEAPPGAAILTDSRLLHSGGKRTAAGTRLASRIFYARAVMRQQENQFVLPPELIENASPKLHGLLGFKTHYGLGMVDGNAIDPAKPKIPIGELSMSRPEAFDQLFDWKFSEDAKTLAAREWDEFAEYLGD